MPPKFPDENLLFLEHRRALFIKKDCAFELAEIRGLIRWNLHLPHHIALSRCGRWLAKSVSTSIGSGVSRVGLSVLAVA
jgi:hypothetical protein